MKNPFAFLITVLMVMAGYMLGYSIIIYSIWNLAMSWLLGLSYLPFVNALGLGVTFYCVQFAIHSYKKYKHAKKLALEMQKLEEQTLNELRRFFDGEGK